MSRTEIVPAGGALSWGAVTGRTEAAPAVAETVAPGISTSGRVLQAGELRKVTKAEEIAATYGLDPTDPWQQRGIDQIQGIDRVAGAWERHKERRLERPDYHTPREALTTAGTDLHNVGSLIGDLLFGD